MPWRRLNVARWRSGRPLLALAGAVRGPQRQRPHLVEGDHRPILGSPLVEREHLDRALELFDRSRDEIRDMPEPEVAG